MVEQEQLKEFEEHHLILWLMRVVAVVVCIYNQLTLLQPMEQEDLVAEELLDEELVVME